MVATALVEPEHDGMEDVDDDDDELESEKRPPGASEDGVEHASALQVSDHIARPEQHRHRHRCKVQGGIDELERGETMRITDAP